MPDLKKHVTTGILAVALTLTLVACDSDDPTNTTSPDDTETTEPIGS